MATYPLDPCDDEGIDGDRQSNKGPKGPKLSIVLAHAVFDRSLSNSELRVLAAFATYADSRTGDCWPSVGTVAKRLGISPRYVYRALEKLRRLGFMTKANRQRRYVGGKCVPVRTVIYDSDIIDRQRRYNESRRESEPEVHLNSGPQVQPNVPLNTPEDVFK